MGFFNVRLGFWWDSGTKSITKGWKLTREIGKWFTAALPVQSCLIDELLGRFRGTLRRYWYLTDGGHFEDLGGYELIRRRLPLIVIIDAECDPDYDFEELANLIRKARLDFNAETSFIDPKKRECEFERASAVVSKYFRTIDSNVFGTLEQLRRGKWSAEPVPERSAYFKSTNADRLSLRHAALAAVKYLDDPDNVSYLMLIKPTLIGEEPEDILNYHSAHPQFPQETTADQFFDEVGKLPSPRTAHRGENLRPCVVPFARSSEERTPMQKLQEGDSGSRGLVLRPRIFHGPATKTGGRLIKHARYYWLLLAESHLTRRLFAGMLAKIAMLPSPAG